jgi:hypothetical protein
MLSGVSGSGQDLPQAPAAKSGRCVANFICGSLGANEVHGKKLELVRLDDQEIVPGKTFVNPAGGPKR